MKLELLIPGMPTSKGRPRFTKKGFAFTPSKTRKAEETLTARVMALMLQRPDRSSWPAQGALAVEVTFTLSVPPSWPAWRRAAALTGRHQPASKPDIDNLAKLAKDALNGVLWVDDAQVVELVARKVYGAEPSTWIVVTDVPHQVERGAA